MNTTWSLHQIILITIKIITLIIIGSLHIQYMMNAIHPQSLLTFIVLIVLSANIVSSIISTITK